MEIIGKDKERSASLRSGSQHACHLLNNVVIPICKELTFAIDTSDTATLYGYVRNLDALHSDYIDKMKDVANSPALVAVIEKSSEDLWLQASGKHRIQNPSIIGAIPEDVMDFVTITGEDIFTFRAVQNISAIEKACIIYADGEDCAKRDELKEVCKVLNRCFNGNAQLFPAYIGIVSGQFAPLKNVTNYKPLIYGTQQQKM